MPSGCKVKHLQEQRRKRREKKKSSCLDSSLWELLPYNVLFWVSGFRCELLDWVNYEALELFWQYVFFPPRSPHSAKLWSFTGGTIVVKCNTRSFNFLRSLRPLGGGTTAANCSQFTFRKWEKFPVEGSFGWSYVGSLQRNNLRGWFGTNFTEWQNLTSNSLALKAYSCAAMINASGLSFKPSFSSSLLNFSVSATSSIPWWYIPCMGFSIHDGSSSFSCSFSLNFCCLRHLLSSSLSSCLAA